MTEIIETDYVIIGAGSAGCTIAYRLSKSLDAKITVVEYGDTDKSPVIQMPAALSIPMNMSRYNWGYVSSPEKYLNKRIMDCPRGKVIGGSSSINGMIFVRGNPEDYENWERSGARGWSYSDVLPYFKRMETFYGPSSKWRGKQGPLKISRAKVKNPIYNAFVDATIEAGYQKLDDYNGFQQEGFGYADMTVWNGSRYSSAKAYLYPAMQTGKVNLLKNTLVDKINFQNKVAKEIECISNGKKIKIKVKVSVILCAGAIGSPTILQRSGVGKIKDLKKLGIEPIKNLDGVGYNLQDHLELYFQVACKKNVSLFKYNNYFHKALIGLQWILTKRGLGATNHFEVLGFIRSWKGISYPDIQFHFLPIAVNYDGKNAYQGQSFQLHIGTMRSKSRGYVRLSSKDPTKNPIISFNYLSHPDDLVEFRRAISLTREIMTMPSIKSYYDFEITPGKNIIKEKQLNDYIKNNVESAYHPCGTCRMGSNLNKNSVVTPNCNVVGFKNLYCADSSIIPQITNGNLNAPTIMIAEKASDIILKRTLKPLKYNTYKNKLWKTKQR